jgi:hypothetical protein
MNGKGDQKGSYRMVATSYPPGSLSDTERGNWQRSAALGHANGRGWVASSILGLVFEMRRRLSHDKDLFEFAKIDGRRDLHAEEKSGAFAMDT